MHSPTTEHLGISRVHTVCAEMNAVWRATASTDLGIDGQIELLEPGSYISTGHIVAVQVKSGVSYFKNRMGRSFHHYPSAYNREYWKRVRMPVILVLHNPDSGVTLFSRIKPQLGSGGPIKIPATSTFDRNSREDLIVCAREDQFASTPEEVLRALKALTFSDAKGCEINGCDIFLAMASIPCGMFFFELTRFDEVLIFTVPEGFGLTTGPESWNFALQCLVSLKLHGAISIESERFFEMCFGGRGIQDWRCPLARTGNNAVELMGRNPGEYLSPSVISRAGEDDPFLAVESLIRSAAVTSFSRAYRWRPQYDKTRSNLCEDLVYRTFAFLWLQNRRDGLELETIVVPMFDTLIKIASIGGTGSGQEDVDSLVQGALVDAFEFFGPDSSSIFTEVQKLWSRVMGASRD